MPKYVKSKKGELSRKIKLKNFKSIRHISQFLARCDEKTWEAYRRVAKDYLDGRKKPPFRIKRAVLRKILKHKPQQLLGHLHHEHHNHSRGKAHLGGGIIEAIHAITNEASNLLGIPAVMDAVGLGPERRDLPQIAKELAECVSETYDEPPERKDKIGDLSRVSSIMTVICWRYGKTRIIIIT